MLVHDDAEKLWLLVQYTCRVPTGYMYVGQTIIWCVIKRPLSVLLLPGILRERVRWNCEYAHDNTWLCTTEPLVGMYVCMEVHSMVQYAWCKYVRVCVCVCVHIGLAYLYKFCCEFVCFFTPACTKQKSKKLYVILSINTCTCMHYTSRGWS